MSRESSKRKGQEQESFSSLPGVLAGMVFGVTEVSKLLVTGQLHTGPLSWGLLIAVGFGVPCVIGWTIAKVGSVVGLTRLQLFWTAAAAVSSVFLAEWWFSAPPPFAPGAPLQGNLWVFIGFFIVAVVPAVVALGRARLRVSVAVVGGLLSLQAVGLYRSAQAPEVPAALADSPNVLLVTLDTARGDRFVRGRQESFDRIASGGVRFQTAISSIPVTGPSHMSMLTGKDPWEHGVLLNGMPLPDGYTTLAQRLQDRGYATGAFVSAYVLDKNIGLGRGFDVYGDHFGWLKGLDELLLGRLWHGWLRHRDPDLLLERRAVEVVDDSLDWLEQQNGAWFAWVHLFDPHGPYTPPPPYDNRFYQGYDPRAQSNHSMDAVSGVPSYMQPSLEGITDLKYVIAQYDGELGYVDGELGRLLDWVQAVDPNTLVIAVGDHGEGLGEHEEWFRHGDFLYEHDLRVPMAIRWPGQISPGAEVAGPVSTTRISDTVLDYLAIDGRGDQSLRSLIDGDSEPEALVHSICFDREANKMERALDPTFRPKWRMASSWAAGQLLVVRESPRMEDSFFLVSGAEAGAGETVSRERMRHEAASVLTGSMGALPALSDADRGLLEALGYVDPSGSEH
jgi:arylsulfatase A-like enzyme